MTKELQLLVGRVEGADDKPILVVARLEAAGRTIVRDQAGDLVLSVEGRKVHVDIEAGRIRQAELAGRWDDIAGNRVARLFLDEAPGDHVKVKIAGVALFSGDVVAVRGEPVEVGEAGGDGGYRDAAEMRVTRVRGLAAGVASDEAGARAKLEEVEADDREQAAARQRKEEEQRRESQRKADKEAEKRARPPRAKVPWRWGTFVSAVFAAVVIAVALDAAKAWQGLLPGPLASLVILALGIHLAGLTIHCWTVRHDVPKVHEVGRRIPLLRRAPWAMHVYLYTLPVPPVLVAFSEKAHSAFWTRAAFAYTAVFPLVLLIIAIVRARLPARRLWQVVRARPLPRDAADGAWGTIEGEVDRDHQDESVLHAVTTRTGRSQTRTYTERNKDGAMVQKESTTYWSDLATALGAVPELRVKTDGGIVEVTTAGAIWSAVTRWTPVPKKGEAARALARVVPGDRVRVLARMRRDGDRRTIKGAGPESLFITGSSPTRLLLSVLAPALVQGALIAVIAILCLW